MSIELLNPQHISVLKETISKTNKRVRIASPTIGFETAKLLINSLKGAQRDCTLITKFQREDFLNHASSLEGLRILIQAGFKVYALQDLQSKLFIFDDQLTILGMSTFKMGGYAFGYEFSFMLKDELDLSLNFSRIYDELLNAIKVSGNWLVDEKRINEEIRIVDKLTKNRVDKRTKYRNISRFGAVLKKHNNYTGGDEIEQLIRESFTELKNNIWLKFTDSNLSKYKPDEKFAPYRLQRNDKIITAFSAEPTDIADSDYIYLTANSYARNKVTTLMLVGRAKCKKFEPDNVASEEDFIQYGWLQEYPYYVELYDLEIFDIGIGQCIPIGKLIRALGNELYCRTQGQNLSIAELNNLHCEETHLSITPAAKHYLEKLFNDYKATYGLVEL